LNHFRDPIKDHRLAFLSKASLVLIVILIMIKVIIVFMGMDIDFRLTYIAVISSLPVLLFSNKRFKIIKQIDWHTLVFFAALFVLMEAVWQTGFFQSLIKGFDITLIPAILIISILLSQLISNVPFVALYLPLLMYAGASTKEMMALAAGSTIAGNLFILGAASNVIIIQNAEKKGESLTFFEFALVGVPITIGNVAVYWIFLSVF
jgi:Na+/H+ antiporter NhaD/arsenite permease-like protein